MSTRMYTLPVEQTQWHVPGVGSTTIFNWEYDEGRDKLLGLYEKGKTKQWNSNERLDWSLEVDLSNPLGFPDYYVSIAFCMPLAGDALSSMLLKFFSTSIFIV